MTRKLTKSRYATVFLKLHDRNEIRLAKDLRGFFSSQEKDIQRRLREAGLGASAETLFDPQEWDERLRAVVLPALFRAALSGATLEQDVFGVRSAEALIRDFMDDLSGKDLSLDEIITADDILIELPDMVQSGIRNAIDTMLDAPYWAKINKTTFNKLDKAITSSLTEGLNLNQMAQRVGDALGVAANSQRALRTARTETTFALNEGSQQVRESLEDDGLVTGKEWLATIDSFTRDDHMAANNQKVPVRDMFLVGGFSTPVPAHPSLPAAQRVNCRCTAISNTILD